MSKMLRYNIEGDKMNSDLPKRKSARLKNFDYSSNGVYFITICTENRANILSPTVQEVVGWLKYQITKEINNSRNQIGIKIFQRSFYDHIVRNDTDYQEIYNYICENPIRWNIDKLYNE